MPSLKELFLLDPEVIFLNHGSFGATPLPVFENYQAWQLELERQPVKFLDRELMDNLQISRQALGEYLHAPADDLVFIPNSTFGVNLIARSLSLNPGDEVLASDHEYLACDNTWKFICQKSQAQYIQHSIAMPFAIEDEIVEEFWKGVNSRTKIIFLSHITSQTTLRFPVETICRRAREADILTIIDGSHAAGQISLEMDKIGADFYIGNYHKWMLAPKGAGFLYTRREKQHLVEPLVVSLGWGADASFDAGSEYLNHAQWMGTHDPAAFVSAIPAEFVRSFSWYTLTQLLSAALIVLSVALILFHRGLRRYESGSAIQVQI